MKFLIYIPTYNRFEKLHFQLTRINKAAELDPSKEITVVISQNGTDQAIPIFRAINIINRNNITNIGANLNIAKGFLIFKEFDCFDFYWILSDDDPIVTIPRDTLLERVDKLDIDLIHFGNTAYPITQLSHNAFLEHGGFPGLGLISLVIYTRHFISNMNLEQSLEEGIRCSFPHLLIIHDTVTARDTYIMGINYRDYFEELKFKENLTAYQVSLRHFPYFFNNFNYFVASKYAFQWCLTNTRFFWRSEPNKRKFFYSMAGLVVTYPLSILSASFSIMLNNQLKNILKKIWNSVK